MRNWYIAGASLKLNNQICIISINGIKFFLTKRSIAMIIVGIPYTITEVM